MPAPSEACIDLYPHPTQGHQVHVICFRVFLSALADHLSDKLLRSSPNLTLMHQAESFLPQNLHLRPKLRHLPELAAEHLPRSPSVARSQHALL